MNMINSTLIDLLISAADTFRNETCRILEQYRKELNSEKRISERFKDEEGYYQQAQKKLSAIAREGIAKAERVFSTKVSEYADQMEQQLKRHLSEPVNGQFREKLSMLSEFCIKPEKIEIEDLLSLNKGNQIGLTALAKTLEKVGSPYTLNYHTTADFEKDIATIRGLSQNLKYIPAEYHSEGCEIYKGIYADYVYPNGSILKNGVKYDSISLIQRNVTFESNIEKIKGFKSVWTADCNYSEAGLNTDNEGTETESETKVVENQKSNEGMQIARQLGRDAARARSTLNELIQAGKLL